MDFLAKINANMRQNAAKLVGAGQKEEREEPDEGEKDDENVG